jgi:TPP-dependent pyruvate/acetoin dehydrogenase alpha subunit
MRQQVNTELSEAVAAAEAHPPKTADQVFDHVYARPPARMEEQRRRIVGQSVGEA